LRLALLRAEGLRGLLGVALLLVLAELLGHYLTKLCASRASCAPHRSVMRGTSAGQPVFQAGQPWQGLVQRRIRILRKASPPSGGVDSSGRLSGPKSYSGRGKRLWMLWRGDTRPPRKSTESSAKLTTFHRRGC